MSDESCDPALLAEYRKQLGACEDFDGIFLPNAKTYEALGSIVFTVDKFEPQDDDIFVVSYPKSGTSWLSEVVSLIVREADENMMKTQIFNRIYVLEPRASLNRLFQSSIAKGNAKMFFGTCVLGLTKLMYHRTDRTGRRIIFTHVRPNQLPKAAQEGKHEIIYLSRNPKDNMVSFFHFHRNFPAYGLGTPFKINWQEFFQIYTSGKSVYGSWFDHIESYCRFAETNKNILFLKYEDMKKDLPKIVGSIGQFLNVSLGDSSAEKIAKLTHIKSLTKQRSRIRPDYATLFTRKGIIGDWKNHFTVAQNEIFERVYKKKMANIPITFEFE